MSKEKKASFSNLDKLKGQNLKNFRNEKEEVKKNKNLLIKSSEENINLFKAIGFDFYKNKNELSLFSYRRVLVLVLYNLEKKFIKDYGSVIEPNEDYLKFYKKRGSRKNIVVKTKDLATINFLIPIRYAEMYFNLMHTYFVNECSELTSYSISQFFDFIVEYLSKEKMEDFKFYL